MGGSNLGMLEQVTLSEGWLVFKGLLVFNILVCRFSGRRLWLPCISAWCSQHASVCKLIKLVLPSLTLPLLPWLQTTPKIRNSSSVMRCCHLLLARMYNTQEVTPSGHRNSWLACSFHHGWPLLQFEFAQELAAPVPHMWIVLLDSYRLPFETPTLHRYFAIRHHQTTRKANGCLSGSS